jgi:hypothetical protein
MLGKLSLADEITGITDRLQSVGGWCLAKKA